MKKYHIIWSILILFFTLTACFLHFYVIYPFAYKDIIEYQTGEYHLDKSLVASVICAESRFQKNAKSARGACGLMQIMPTTAEWIAGQLSIVEYDIFDEKTNIQFGCYYLRYLFNKYQNEVYVLSCYNAGESVVSAWGSSRDFSIDKIKYSETKNYVNKVLRLKKHYASRF